MAKKVAETTLTDIELKKRAENFKLRHVASKDERADAQTFWNEFFAIFDIDRFKVMRFETPTKRDSTTRQGFIDTFWKGKLLIEHKSAHKNSEKDFEKALEQALDYVKPLKEEDKPKHIIICNFKKFKVYDVVQKKTAIIELDKLHLLIDDFNFLIGFAKQLENEEEQVNQQAAKLLAALYSHVKTDFKDQEDLRLMMIRILFCLFAEDTGIFDNQKFTRLISLDVEPSGKNLNKILNELFEVLNTPMGKRTANVAQCVADFPYVNGTLFETKLHKLPTFSAAFVKQLIECCKFDWTPISPVIFGSLFQTVIDNDGNDKRGSLGAHYTSERNIMKIIEPLFINELRNELLQAKGDKRKLEKLRIKISDLRFLDPACGCGNFLIIAYRELRMLDIEILQQLNFSKEAAYMTASVHLDNFYGIEYDEFSAYIAKVALWLMEHKCNMQLFQSCNINIPTIPLREAAKIKQGNALRLDWASSFPKKADFILGNPPFLGKHLQNTEQKEDMELVFKNVQGSGVLDYVTAWYIRAAQYIKGTTIKAAFVSTNSIAQGEQVGLLWKEMFEQYGIKIHFAHQTFRWSNEAEGVAAVHCVIVGFAAFDASEKYVYEYENINAEPIALKVKNINPYLVEGNDMYIESRTNPICKVPKMVYGSKIVDDKNFLMTDEEKSDYVKKEPKGAKFIKAILSGDEFINGKNRWCFWLVDAAPNEVKELPLLLQRIKKVKEFRLKSTKKQTVELANTPMFFAEIRQPKNDFLLIPRTSSENRVYIPFGFYTKDFIVSDSCTCMPNATLFDFGMITSKMHMAWVKYVCGRLKSDYRYSNSIVYNNYPFPQNVSATATTNVEKAVSEVLSIREKHTKQGATLADMYSNLTMPKDLQDAHKALDKAVDACYGKQNFASDAKRIAYLFGLYENLIKK
jgi:type I restriction-modification system DNA methylase subunit